MTLQALIIGSEQQLQSNTDAISLWGSRLYSTVIVKATVQSANL